MKHVLAAFRRWWLIQCAKDELRKLPTTKEQSDAR